MLDVRRLRILREVAAHGTIAACADALSYTPSAVSQQLAALEREVGLPLLERNGRGVRLTDAAERLVEHTERILAALEAAEADLMAMTEDVEGNLRVAAFPTAASTFVPPAIAALQVEHAAVRVAYRELESDDSLPALKHGEIDLAVAYDFPPHDPDPGIDREELFEDPLRVALPVGHEAATAESVPLSALAGERWITPEEGTWCRDLVTLACATAGFVPHVAFESNDFRVFSELVSAGLGVAVIPGLAAAFPHAGVVIRPLRGQRIARRVFIAIRRGSGRRPAIAAMAAALKGQAYHYAAVTEPLTARPRAPTARSRVRPGSLRSPRSAR
jgi:DNA-binding transcriptional LysR family regulator